MIYLAPYGTAWTLRGMQLVDRSTGQYKASPTLAAGDVKIEKDGGAAANLATLPIVAPPAGSSLDVPFSAAEMQCKQAVLRFVDAAGAEWNDDCLHIFTCGDPNAFFAFNFFTPTVGLSIASQGAVAGAVWDELHINHAIPGSFGESLALSDAERASIAAAILDAADSIEAGLTVRNALRLIAAAAAGKTSGGGTSTFTIRNAVADSKTRVTATVDADGNRSAVSTDLT